MKLKKLLAALCACALVFALAVPSFAATAGNIENKTETIFVGGTLPDTGVTVSVSVLTYAEKLYVNPYGLPYKIADGDVDGDPDVSKIQEGTTTNGWFSNTAVIKNESEDALKVGVTMKTELKSNTVTVVEDDPGNNPVTINTLYGKLQLAQATLSAAKVIEPDWDSNVKEVTIPAASTTMTAPDYSNGFILNGGTPEQNNLGQTVVKPAFAAFRLRGSAFLAPGNSTAGDAGWGLNDLADVTVAFSFKPDTP